jgi:hypothetical protein
LQTVIQGGETLKRCKLKPNAYKVLSRAIEEGIDWGWQHAHKHTDKPDDDSIKQYIEDDIMNCVCEVFDFD